MLRPESALQHQKFAMITTPALRTLALLDFASTPWLSATTPILACLKNATRALELATLSQFLVMTEMFALMTAATTALNMLPVYTCPTTVQMEMLAQTTFATLLDANIPT